MFIFGRSVRSVPRSTTEIEEEIPDLVPLDSVDHHSITRPRYHVHAHQPICQYEHPIHKSDGEMVERGWAASRPTADVKKSITMVDWYRPLLVKSERESHAANLTGCIDHCQQSQHPLTRCLFKPYILHTVAYASGILHSVAYASGSSVWWIKAEDRGGRTSLLKFFGIFGLHCAVSSSDTAADDDQQTHHSHTLSSDDHRDQPTRSRSLCTVPQVKAMRAYRARNPEVLKAKARERMASRRRQRLIDDPTARADYQARSRASSQRYRNLNRATLACNSRSRRADKYIDTHGFEAWAAAFVKRNPPTEDPPTVESLSPQHSEPASADDDPDAELHDFLDNRDPTTHPDYVPKAGEQRYFQRGQWRWY
ncbi:hypothetical protein B0H13DRAFT_1901812 [Mycena leptocephala]|nr:hypothetical protein B0H13DRAFT_1901812 [Mycena leptocephala]